MRAIFFGTPALAVPSLEAVHAIADVALVICQPDRPAGRGMKLRAPAVKERALALGLPVEQPTKVRTEDFRARLVALEADVAVVVAYGRILPRGVLDAPRTGCVNVHASILPRWRGAGPIQWAIVSGDRETGVCLMQMDEGMDTGAVIACERTPIAPNETAAELGERLGGIGAALLTAHLPRWVEGATLPTPQPAEGVTMAPMLTKEDGRIDWRASAREVHDRVRGLSPWPGAFSELDGAPLKIHETRVHAEDGALGEPGAVCAVSADAIVVACGRGAVAIRSLQEEGRRRLSAAQFVSGHALAIGQRLGA